MYVSAGETDTEGMSMYAGVRYNHFTYVVKVLIKLNGLLSVLYSIYAVQFKKKMHNNCTGQCICH